MTALPFLPKTAPFTSEDIDLLNGFVARATPLQRSWLSGFLAGLDAAQGHATQTAAPPRPRTPLTILYASESGNAESDELADGVGGDGERARILGFALQITGAATVSADVEGDGDPGGLVRPGVPFDQQRLPAR